MPLRLSETMRQCCSDFGIPQICLFWTTIPLPFSKNRKLTVDELIAGKTVHLTQFDVPRTNWALTLFLQRLQAKGRIERLWVTLQSRLPVEFAKRGITTVSEANRFLETEYRELFNQRFAVERSRVYFCLCRKDLNLDSILCVKHTRKQMQPGHFRLKIGVFKSLDEGFPIINARREITVLINPRFGIRVEYGGRIYNTIRYLKPQNKNANTEVPQKVSKSRTTPPAASQQ